VGIMAVSTTNAFDGPFIANGVATTFPFTFTALTDADVTVEIDGVAVSGYSVTVAGGGGGSVIFDSAPTSGEIYILLEPSFEQLTQFEDGSGWLASPVNRVNDRAALRDQRNRRDTDRALKVPLGESPLPMASLAGSNGKALGIIDDVIQPIPFNGADNAQSAADAIAAKVAAQTAQGLSEAAGDQSVIAKGQSEAARDTAIAQIPLVTAAGAAQVSLATTQATASGNSAMAAAASAASVGFLNAVKATGDAPPYTITSVTGGIGTGVGGTPGTYKLILANPTTGGEVWGTVGSDGKVSAYPSDKIKGGLSAGSVSTTATWPSAAGFTTAPTAPTIAVGQLQNGQTFTALTSDNQKVLLWQVAAGVLAPVNDGSGSQMAWPLPSFITSQISSIGMLDPDAWEDSGYAFFVIDANRRVLIGAASSIASPTPIIATGVAAGTSTFTSLDPDAWEDSGYSYFVIDGNRRVLSGLVTATVTAAATPDADTLYDLVQLSDGTNNQTFSTARATGKLTQLSPSGSNNIPVAIRPDGYAIYKSDRANGAPGGLYACPVAGGTEIPVMPLQRIVSLGDSLAAASYIAGSSYQAQAASALGWQCDVFGINGQTARQIAARWGARPMYVTLASNTLLASGETSVTTLTENPITGSVAAKIHGRLGLTGPSATLKRTGDGSDGQAYVMVQDAGGSDTAVAAGTRFYPDMSSINNGAFLSYRYDGIMIISASRNSYERADEIIASISQIATTLKALSIRFLIAKVLPGCDPNNTTSPLDGYGTPSRAVIDYVNARLTAMWPDNVYDILPWLQALKDGSANDQADVDAGVSPRSTRWNGSTYDFLHMNATARAAIGTGPFKDLINSKGWNKP
jgi:hypothetical protein